MRSESHTFIYIARRKIDHLAQLFIKKFYMGVIITIKLGVRPKPYKQSFPKGLCIS